MANAKKCDRCGKLFESYNIDAGYIAPNRYTNIIIKSISLAKETYKELGEYDLCKECNESFSRWIAKPRIVKHECSNFGNVDEQNHACKICPRYQECEEATKENKKKGCNAFGTYDESVDCLLCPKCDECKEVTNSIKEASSNGE